MRVNRCLLVVLMFGATAQAQSWMPAASLPSPRSFHTATLLSSGKVLVFGGFNNNLPLASTRLYNPATNAWTVAPNLPPGLGRRFHTATLLPSGKVLVAGGEGTGFLPLSSVQVYDPATNAFSTAAPLPTSRADHTATLLLSGKVLVAGGRDATGPDSSAKLYDPATNVWSAAGSLAVSGRIYHTATLLQSGKVLLAGGNDGAVAIERTELYDPATNQWSVGGPMVVPCDFRTATLLPNGKVLAAGGGPFGRSSTELYDPATNAWTLAASLTTERSLHTATLLPSGNVLVVGGSGAGGPFASAEVYDPATNVWSAAASLGTGRSLHTETLLSSGQVLVVGGFNLASAELYAPSLNVWKFTHLADANAPDLGDPDGDGVVTLSEYGIATPPQTPDAAPHPASRFAYPDGERLRLFLQRDPTHNDVTVVAESAGSVAGPWSPLATSTLGTPFTGPGYVSGDDATPGVRTVEIRDTVNIPDAAGRFMRVRVVRP